MCEVDKVCLKKFVRFPLSCGSAEHAEAATKVESTGAPDCLSTSPERRACRLPVDESGATSPAREAPAGGRMNPGYFTAAASAVFNGCFAVIFKQYAKEVHPLAFTSFFSVGFLSLFVLSIAIDSEDVTLTNKEDTDLLPMFCPCTRRLKPQPAP